MHKNGQQKKALKKWPVFNVSPLKCKFLRFKDRKSTSNFPKNGWICNTDFNFKGNAFPKQLQPESYCWLLWCYNSFICHKGKINSSLILMQGGARGWPLWASVRGRARRGSEVAGLNLCQTGGTCQVSPLTHYFSFLRSNRYRKESLSLWSPY